jgi:hypothetical protein
MERLGVRSITNVNLGVHNPGTDHLVNLITGKPKSGTPRKPQICQSSLTFSQSGDAHDCRKL